MAAHAKASGSMRQLRNGDWEERLLLTMDADATTTAFAVERAGVWKDARWEQTAGTDLVHAFLSQDITNQEVDVVSVAENSGTLTNTAGTVYIQWGEQDIAAGHGTALETSPVT